MQGRASSHYLTPTHSSRFNLRKQVTPDPLLSAEPAAQKLCCVFYPLCPSNLVLPSLEAEIITYFSLHPHSSISIISVLERQCHCYGTQLCRCEVNCSCQKFNKWENNSSWNSSSASWTRRSHNLHSIWQGSIKWVRSPSSPLTEARREVTFSQFWCVCHLSFLLSHFLLDWDFKCFL